MRKKTMQSIVEKAKNMPITDRLTDRISGEERIDLALAYLRGEIRQTQAIKLLWPERAANSCTTLFYCLLVHGIRDAVKAGKLKV